MRAAPSVGHSHREFAGFRVGGFDNVGRFADHGFIRCRTSSGEQGHVLDVVDVGEALGKGGRRLGQPRHKAEIAGFVGEAGKEGALQVPVLRKRGTHYDALSCEAQHVDQVGRIVGYRVGHDTGSVQEFLPRCRCMACSQGSPRALADARQCGAAHEMALAAA
jgi:hypothetical protein